MGIIQPCILGSGRPVRPVWMPGRGQGSPLICHRNCWCRTSRVSRSVSVDLSLSPCFHTCSLYLTLSLLCRSDFTLSLSLRGCYGNYILVLQAFSPGRGAWIWYWNSFTVSPPKTRRQNACWENVSAEKPTDVLNLYVFFMFNISSVDFLVYFVVWLLSHLWDTECDQELAG